jgi:hypothetical protein
MITHILGAIAVFCLNAPWLQIRAFTSNVKRLIEPNPRLTATIRSSEAEYTIFQATNRDIQLAAEFLGRYWYPVEISRSQRLEFTRIEALDLQRRYGERVGPKKFPSGLFILQKHREIIGFENILPSCYYFLSVCRCVGLDCQRFDGVDKKFKSIYDPSLAAYKEELRSGQESVCVLADHLPDIHIDRRLQ